MLNKQTIYEKLMTNISQIVKKQLNEMARKSVTRTIDKKLWLTVSSIISRNRSTEAENIKPIGTDKNNLLQRYVAALLIMKKPCPNNVSEIDDLKTFKNIGNKFIELGGTISEIIELYNKNNGDEDTISSNTKDDISNNDVQQNTSANEPIKKSSFFDDMFDETDDEDDSLLGSISSTNNVNDMMLDTLVTVDNKTSLDKAWYIVTNNATSPKGFKLVKPKNPDEYQKYVYIPKGSKQIQGGALYKYLLKQGWKEYRGLGLTRGDYNTNIADNYSLDRLYIYDYYARVEIYLGNENNCIIPVHLNINSTEKDIEKQISKIGTDMLPYYQKYQRYYKEMLDIYKRNVSNIDNKKIKDIISNDSFYEYVLVSPDGGLMFSKYSEFDNNQWGYDDTFSYDNRNFILIKKPNGRVNRYGEEHSFYKSNKTVKTTYTLTFTGDLNYTQQLSDTFLDDQQTEDKKYLHKLKKAKTAFRKCLDLYGYNLIYALGWPATDYKWSFDKNGILQVETTRPYVGYNRCDNVENYFWGNKPKNKPVKTSRKKVKQYIKVTTEDAQKKDPSIIAQVSDINDHIRCTQYKIGSDHRVVVTLDNEGIDDYKNFLKK